MNKVDQLLAEAKQIQDKCKHHFKIVKNPVLKESLVKDVFVGYTVGPTVFGASEGSAPGNFTLKCAKCSKVKRTNILATCPRCFGDIKVSNSYLGGGNREKYFGLRNSYYAIQIRGCWKCKFRIACDQWDH